jgi:hypothetical protein
MSVVPHSSDQSESKPVVASRGGVVALATSVFARTKDATTNALSKVSGGKRETLQSRLAHIADSAASDPQHPTGAVARKRGLARVAEIGRDSVLPEIERTSVKLRERARPDRLKQDYQNYLHSLHERVLDRPTETLFFTPTKEPVALADLTIRGPNADFGHDYRPTPCRLFEWALAGVDYDFSKLTFVDHGAGKGRVLLLASEHPFAAIGGIEFATELHDAAAMNIAQYPRSRMKCRNVACVLEDACEVGPPEGEAVHYFFNPFAREMFAEVLHNLIVSYRKRPRRLYLILIDPIATDLIDNSGVFMRVELPPAERLKVRLFSPYNVAVYRSLA